MEVFIEEVVSLFDIEKYPLKLILNGVYLIMRTDSYPTQDGKRVQFKCTWCDKGDGKPMVSIDVRVEKRYGDSWAEHSTDSSNCYKIDQVLDIINRKRETSGLI